MNCLKVSSKSRVQVASIVACLTLASGACKTVQPSLDSSAAANAAAESSSKMFSSGAIQEFRLDGEVRDPSTCNCQRDMRFSVYQTTFLTLFGMVKVPAFFGTRTVSATFGLANFVSALPDNLHQEVDVAPIPNDHSNPRPIKRTVDYRDGVLTLTTVSLKSGLFSNTRLTSTIKAQVAADLSSVGVVEYRSTAGAEDDMEGVEEIYARVDYTGIAPM